MATIGKFRPGKSGNPGTQFKPGNQHRWQSGQSGNPAGIARRRAEFEEQFYDALLGKGDADEAASLLWEAARNHEPWAIQALLQRLAPETKQINVSHGNEDELDYSQLSDHEIATLAALAERAQAKPVTNQSGAGTPDPEGVRDAGLGGPGTEH